MNNLFADIEGADPEAKARQSHEQQQEQAPPQAPPAQGSAEPPPPQNEAPPPYSTLPGAPPEVGASAWNSPAPAMGVSPGFPTGGVKVGYMDFMPKLVKKKTFSSNVYEDFT